MLEARVDEQLVGVENQAPLLGCVAPQHQVHPRGAGVGSKVRPLAPPDDRVRLAEQVVDRAVVGAVVHEQEPIDAEAAVVLEEELEARSFVAGHDDRNDLVGTQLEGAAGDRLDAVRVVGEVDAPKPAERVDAQVVHAVGETVRRVVGEVLDPAVATTGDGGPVLRGRKQVDDLEERLLETGPQRQCFVVLRDGLFDPAEMRLRSRHAEEAVGFEDLRHHAVARSRTSQRWRCADSIVSRSTTLAAASSNESK